jgi:hypothetical protein
LAENIDKIEQHRVLDRDDGGRRNISEEGKDKLNAKPKDGLWSRAALSRQKPLLDQAAFQNALKKCGGILEATLAKILGEFEKGDKAKRVKGLTRGHIHGHIDSK